MIAMTTLVIERSQVHWEAVLVTAIPSFFAMVAAIGAAWISGRVRRHVQSIDKAVNGTTPGEPTIRESVEQINTAVNGASTGEPSIRENVETLTARRDLDPDVCD